MANRRSPVWMPQPTLPTPPRADRTTTTLPRAAAATCVWLSSPRDLQAETASVQPHDARRLRRAAEIDQFLAAQHHAADVAVVAARRVLAAEAALESPPPIRAAVQAHAGCVPGLVEQLHVGGEAATGRAHV